MERSSGSMRTSRGCQNAPHRFFPWGRSTAGFAANGGINLREQGGRNLDIVNPTHINSGRKTSHIARDAPTERDDQIAARKGVVGQEGEHIADAAQGFTALPSRENVREGMEPGLL